MSELIGAEFQAGTRYSRAEMQRRPYREPSVPDTEKRLPRNARIPLPPASDAPRMVLHEALLKRRSIRRYSASALSLGELSYLLWAADGVTARANGFGFRTAPSAGALYPVETYVIVNSVSELDAGVYYYRAADHSLFLLEQGDFREATAMAALGQEMCGQAPVVFAWTAVFPRSVWRYGQRAYRYVYLDAGHIAQNLALAAVALDLGTCQIGALFDDEVNSILGVDGERESVIYMSVVGRPAQ